MSTHEARLQALREQLKADRLDGFVVPICDEHMSEYVGAYAQRLAWLTGFEGSAGSAAILPEDAAIFVDGRYTLQVRDQVDGNLWQYQSVPQTSVAEWLSHNAPQGGRIGYDPWLHTKSWVEQAKKALAERGAELVAVDTNPVDKIWPDQPEPSKAKLVVHPEELAGRNAHDKRQEIADWLQEKNADAVVLSALDSIAWTFNIRGKDVERTPVALAYAVVHKDGTADFYVAPEKMADDVAKHLGNAVRVHDRAAFARDLAALKGKHVVVDPERAVSAIFAGLEAAGAIVHAMREPVVLAKAIKNPVEIAGHRAAQARDGAAVSKFLRWLSVAAPKGGQTEISAQDKLLAFREETGLLQDLSFDTISGAGPNGAICHYRVSEESNLPIEMNSLYLVDSGGQYRDGTTDITRTVPVGEPTQEMRDRFTRVLKGHIALARAHFPAGTRGGQLDTLARQYLWEVGLDYAHGTGHGVGSFLSVHEGPQRIAMSAGGQAGTDEPLRAGMILSNEPGYYKAGEYGIRIENLVLVVERDIPGAEKPVLGFETLTFVPIERRLIDVSMLSPAERQWVDAYHAKVVDIVGPQLDGDDKAWLTAQCAPL
ncbi:aminopeptidase P family protein [Sphingomonas sp. C3-2]|uniref:aminopeptidase P family protein n=1 Tax=Sphingomonas sp. C3-2 TaxID=3062169 RepID=UPI00294ADE3A|nr:aminopeptidase P family protein [Sphingomonas sp. C3-2]WOK37848.1 aminopeptidase P family protein [Sphingomonas sp. C3-2]